MGPQRAGEIRHSTRRRTASKQAAKALAPADPARQSQRVIGNQSLSRLAGSQHIQRQCACGATGPGLRPATVEAEPNAIRPVGNAPGLQTKLTIGAPGDTFEQEADRVADQVMRMPAHPGSATQRTCSECARDQIRRQPLEEEEEEGEIQAKGAPGRTPALGASAADRIGSLNAGRPLSEPERDFFEPRFGYDFSHVRVHDDAPAAAAAASIQARAFTKGPKVVFGSGQRSGTPAGLSLMAHELTHVIQQGHATPLSRRQDTGRPRGLAEASRPGAAARRSAPAARVQGGRAGAAIQRAMLCSKRLEAPVIGWFANHAYVDDTGRDDCMGSGMSGNLAIQALQSGNFLRGCAVKTDTSTDPQSRTPNMKPCDPKPGIGDVSACLRQAFAAYIDPSFYANPSGPNSNTFAGTLARACCADASPRGLGWVPGWNHAPAGGCRNRRSGGGGGRGRGNVRKVQPRPFTGTVQGSFNFSFRPPANPQVGKAFVLTLFFDSNGTTVAADVQFRLMSVDPDGTMHWQSTNPAPINIAPVGDPPKVIRAGNPATSRAAP